MIISSRLTTVPVHQPTDCRRGPLLCTADTVQQLHGSAVGLTGTGSNDAVEPDQETHEGPDMPAGPCGS